MVAFALDKDKKPQTENFPYPLQLVCHRRQKERDPEWYPMMYLLLEHNTTLSRPSSSLLSSNLPCYWKFNILRPPRSSEGFCRPSTWIHAGHASDLPPYNSSSSRETVFSEVLPPRYPLTPSLGLLESPLILQQKNYLQCQRIVHYHVHNCTTNDGESLESSKTVLEQ